MTEHEYRTLPRLANSDLTELAGLVLGRKMVKATPETLLFGSRFHRLILEPETLSQTEAASWPTADYDTLMEMRKALVADAELVAICANAEREIVRIWECPETGLPLKGRLDIVALPRRRHLIDLKTTSVRSMYDFVRSITEYHYDRQAAFYLSSDPAAEYFEFVGVGKQPPYYLFRHSLHRHCVAVERGRQKMNALLKRAKAEFDKPDGWRPSSWSR